MSENPDPSASSGQATGTRNRDGISGKSRGRDTLARLMLAGDAGLE